ncbi:ankyrin repeat domain-containing protein [Halobacteriovorax sp. HLS]|uniref:ankyrin repeat domain-containing protein n=1 Tax=Halobacteriovorax sp. HLS TaxID=2234000 RepID=UPI000FD9156D|nr:ankyrin repeat domain-containing protein [Halobacteriovorax sp. HLS]
MRYVLTLALLITTTTSFAKWDFTDLDEAFDVFYRALGDSRFDADPEFLEKYLTYSNRSEGRVGGLNPDFNYGDEERMTLLGEALKAPITKKRSQVIDLLIKYGADLDWLLEGKVSQKGKKWAFTSDFEFCQQLIYRIDGYNNKEYRSIELIKKITSYSSRKLGIKGGLHPQYSCLGGEFDEYNSTFLHWMAGGYENDYEATKVLIRNFGIKTDHVNNFGYTPLYMQVSKNNFGAVRALVEGGADVNFVQKVPNKVVTPILEVTSLTDQNKLDIFLYLVKNGAKLHMDWSSAYGKCTLFYRLIHTVYHSPEEEDRVISIAFRAMKERNYKFKMCDDESDYDYSRYYRDL